MSYLDYDAVLGTDELGEKGVIIDYLNGKLKIGEQLLRFKKHK